MFIELAMIYYFQLSTLVVLWAMKNLHYCINTKGVGRASSEYNEDSLLI